MHATNMTIGAGRGASYTVEPRGNCILIYGAVPASSFGKLVKLVPKKSVFDTQLARIAGCSMAMGPSEETKALIAEMTPAAINRARMIYSGKGVSEKAIRWLAVGERGCSSDAMFLALTGLKPVDMTVEATAYPHDPDDLSRCRLLLEQVPELASKLEAVADISPIWSRLAASWDALCATMDRESPQWRAGKGAAPETYRLMKTLLEPVVTEAQAQPGKSVVERSSPEPGA